MATPKDVITARMRMLYPTPSLVSGGDEEEEEFTGPRPSANLAEIKARIAERVTAASGIAGFAPAPPVDPTLAQSFATGVRNGFVAPMTIFGVQQNELELDEANEKIGSFMGELVGFGLGFVPFGLIPAAGVMRAGGYALKGAGFAGAISNPAVREFVKFTLGGTIQSAGMSKTVEEIPKNALIGAALGGLLDGFFLARHLKNAPRTGTDIVLRGEKPIVGRRRPGDGLDGPGSSIVADGTPVRSWRVDLEDEVYPIAALPGVRKALPSGAGQLVRTDVLRQEIRLIPSPAKQLGEIRETVVGLQANKSYEEILTELVRVDYVESLLLEGIQPGMTKSVVESIRTKAPNAQVMTRNVIKNEIDEVFVHNPTDVESRLRPDQMARWLEGNPIPGQQALYRGTVYKATGLTTKEGFVQLQALDNRGTFAAKRAEVNFPITPVLFDNFHPKTPTFVRMAQVLELKGQRDVGFTIRSAETELTSVRRGVVNTTDFDEVEEFTDFMKKHGDEIARTQANSLDEATRIVAKLHEVPGVKEVQEGILKKVTVFDQTRVKFIGEPPRIGVEVDQSITSTANELLSFEPSWKNSIIGPLRASGFKEKDIVSYIEQRAVSEARRIETIMDDEFINTVNAARAQFLEGCL